MDPASYNNSPAPGSSPVLTPQQPVISSGGDIILQPEKPKKVKRLVVIVSLLVAFILAVGGIVVFTGVFNSPKSIFNNLASFCLNGEQKNVLPEKSESEDYRILSAAALKTDGDLKYFSSLDELTRAVLSKVKSNEAQEYALAVVAWKEYVMFENSFEDFVNEYTSETKDVALKNIKKKYDSLISSNNTTFSLIGQNMYDFFSIQSGFMDEVASMGCNLDELDEMCGQKVQEIDSREGYSSRLTALLRDVADDSGTQIIKALRKSWEISEAL